MQISQFVKGKGQIIEEYQRTKRKVYSGVAGRNFSYEPGFMYDMMNELEIDTKLKLSDLNYTILEQMVNQELKRKGLDYDLDYKNAALAWELEKAGLLNDWERELAGIKRTRADEEESVKMLAIEVSKRGAILISAKAAIELELEGYRKELADLDASTGAYEVRLAQAKILTAEKKLEIIPYIEQLIDIENELIGKEYQLLDKAELMYDKELSISDKMQEVVSKEYEVAQIQTQVIEKKFEVQEKDNEIIQKAYELLEEVKALNIKYAELLEKQKESASSQIELSEKDIELSTARESEITSKEGLIDSKRSLISYERNVIDNKNILIDDELNIANKKTSLIIKDGEVLNKEKEIIDVITNSIIPKKESLIEIENSVIEKESEILPLIEQAVSLEKNVIDKQTEVVDAEIDAMPDYEALIEKETEINAVAGDTVLIAYDLADMVKAVIEKTQEILDKTAQLNISKQATLEEAQGVYQQEVVKQQYTQNLITIEESLIQYTISQLTPALDDLIDKIQDYAQEIYTQIDIQNQTYDEKYNTLDMEALYIDKKEEVINKKSLLMQAVINLNNELSAFTDDKLDRLSTAYANFETASDTEISSKERQAEIRREIAEINQNMADLIEDKVDGEINVFDAEKDSRQSSIDLKTAELDLKQQSLDQKIALLEKESDNFQTYTSEWSSVKEAVTSKREESFSTVKANKKLTQKTEFDISIENDIKIEAEQKRATASIANSTIDKIEKETDAKTQEEVVTAKLEHLLSQE